MVRSPLVVSDTANRDELLFRCRQLEAVLLATDWIPRDWRLTESEALIVNVLAMTGSSILSRAAVHGAVWGLDPDGGPEPKIVDVYLTRIRKKLTGTGIEIVTVWGRGWYLTDAARQICRQLRTRAEAA